MSSKIVLDIVNISKDYNVDPILIDALHNNNYIKTENMIHDNAIRTIFSNDFF